MKDYCCVGGTLSDAVLLLCSKGTVGVTEHNQRRILVVDDSDGAVAVSDMLTAVGYPVHHTARGLAGLVAVEEEEPALIILSWAIPFIDGRIFLTALRSGLTTPPPVLALISPSDDPVPAHEAGAAAVLRRPIDSGTLLREVERLLG
jgi:DNA-binding response OmpR family regulator